MLRTNLMYYLDFYSLFNNPEKDWETILENASDRLHIHHFFTKGAWIEKKQTRPLKISRRAMLFIYFQVLSDSNNYHYRFLF